MEIRFFRQPLNCISHKLPSPPVTLLGVCSGAKDMSVRQASVLNGICSFSKNKPLKCDTRICCTCVKLPEWEFQDFGIDHFRHRVDAPEPGKGLHRLRIRDHQKELPLLRRAGFRVSMFTLTSLISLFQTFEKCSKYFHQKESER